MTTVKTQDNPSPPAPAPPAPSKLEALLAKRRAAPERAYVKLLHEIAEAGETLDDRADALAPLLDALDVDVQKAGSHLAIILRHRKLVRETEPKKMQAAKKRLDEAAAIHTAKCRSVNHQPSELDRELAEVRAKYQRYDDNFNRLSGEYSSLMARSNTLREMNEKYKRLLDIDDDSGSGKGAQL